MDNLEVLNTWYDKLHGSPIYQLKNGNVQTYIQIDGKETDNGKVRFTTNTQDALIKKIKNVIKDVQSGKIILKQDVEKKSINCPALINRMLQELHDDLRTNKYVKKSKAIEKINIFEKILEIVYSHNELSATPINMWTMRHCDLFRKQIATVSKKSTPSVNIKYFNKLENLLSFAQIHYNLENNVVTDYRHNKSVISNGYFKVSRRERKLILKTLMSEWSIAKMRSYFQSIKDKDYIWYMLIYVLANTGVRRSELFGFRYNDFTYSSNDQSYLTVCGQIDRDGNRLEFTKTESSDYRQIPIGMGLAKKLKEYIDTMKANPMINNPEGILFPMLNGFKIGSKTKVGNASYYKAPTGRSRLALMMTGDYEMPKGLAFHFFRSWIATQWAKYEIYNEFMISRYLGHTDMNTTKDSYIHVNDGTIENINVSDFKENLLF